MALVGTSLLNLSIYYSLFVGPLLSMAVAPVLCHPFFFVPSTVANYYFYKRYKSYFLHGRSFIVNMWLKENGR